MSLRRCIHMGGIQVAVLAPALALASCTGPPGLRGMDPDFARKDRLPCTVILENYGISDLHIYAVRGGTSRIPLGTVASLDQRRVRVPQALMGARYINLLAVPAAAGDPFLSERVYLEPGTEVVWRLLNDLTFSSLFVRSAGGPDLEIPFP